MRTLQDKYWVPGFEGRIVADPHRPGPGRVRLHPESIAVWAIVGYAKAIAGRDDLGEVEDAVVRQVEHDYAISDEAVRATLDWYACQPLKAVPDRRHGTESPE